MDVFLITFSAVGLLAGAFLWAQHTVNTAARWRQREQEQLRRQSDAAWARTLESLQSESAKRRAGQRLHTSGKLRSVK